MHAKLIPVMVAATLSVAHAGPYVSTSSTIDVGGARATSADYSQDASAGGIGGTSTASTPAVLARQGYTGQIVETTGLQVSASPTSIDEGSTRQLTATQLQDDGTTAVLDPASVAWSVVTGPITSISSAGLATAGAVYQTTPASIQGEWGAFNASVGLSIVDVSPDNYLGFAADGIDDSWQVQYFGAPPNSHAGPNADPDGDGQNNLLEFLAGVTPDDPESRFLFRIEPVAGQPAWKNLVFSPRITGRTYTVVTNTDLGATWLPLAGGVTSDNGNERTVTDPNAGGSRKFYRVDIAKP